MVDERARRFRAELVASLDDARIMLEAYDKLIVETEEELRLWQLTGDGQAVHEAEKRLAELRQDRQWRQDEVNRLCRDLAQFDTRSKQR